MTLATYWKNKTHYIW